MQSESLGVTERSGGVRNRACASDLGWQSPP